MNVTELIDNLKAFVSKHGDLHVRVCGDDDIGFCLDIDEKRRITGVDIETREHLKRAVR